MNDINIIKKVGVISNQDIKFMLLFAKNSDAIERNPRERLSSICS